MRQFKTLLVSVALALGCTPSVFPQTKPDAEAWDGSVQQWGTLREVMHGDIMDGRVRLSEVTDRLHVVGIGAPDKLQGEILIAGSLAWVAKVQGGTRIEVRQSLPDDSAVFLAVAQVPRWSEVTLDKNVSAEEFDDFIQRALRQSGLDKLETVPFEIEGDLSSLKLHVLNGQCPFAEVKADIEGAGPPHRTTLSDVRGLLVGFYAEKGAGRITHHWTRTHVHALVGPEDDRMAGHVDEVALKAGAILRLPRYAASHNGD